MGLRQAIHLDWVSYAIYPEQFAIGSWNQDSVAPMKETNRAVEGDD
jgi:hypothetical protein